MIIAKNDEEKRSQVWRAVTVGSFALVVIVVVYFLFKMFTGNPIVGSWESEDGNLSLSFLSSNEVIVTVADSAVNGTVDVSFDYTIDRNTKIVTIEGDGTAITKAVEASDGAYTEDVLNDSLDPLITSFDYSVDQEVLTLTEREYGEQFTFIKK